MKMKSESKVAQSCLTLRDPMDYSVPGSSVLGIFQARVLEWGAIAFSVCELKTALKRYAVAATSLQPCLALFNSIDGSPPGSPVPRIPQAGTLEWIAISFSNA